MIELEDYVMQVSRRKETLSEQTDEDKKVKVEKRVSVSQSVSQSHGERENEGNRRNAAILAS